MQDKPKAGSKFWTFIKDAAQPEEAELFLWGPISNESWWGDEVTPKQFADDLKALGDVKNITVRINSPGGDVFAAIAISGVLRDHVASVIAQVDGLCASAATIVMCNADLVTVSASSLIMIHDPWSAALGTAEDMDKMAEVLRKCKDSIIEAYKVKTGLGYEELSEMMKFETWMSGREAVDKKFADELIGEEPIGATTNAVAYHPGVVFASLRAKMNPEPEEQSEIDRLRVELELLSQ